MEKNLTALLSSHPAVVMLSLHDWLGCGNTISYDSEINWLGLGDAAAAYASNAYENKTVLESVIWGSIAITVREKLAETEAGGPYKLVDAMRVRYNLILRFGSHPGDPLFDARVILEWFYRAVPLSIEQATREAELWKSAPNS